MNSLSDADREAIRKLVAAAPPPTAEQLARLRELLMPYATKGTGQSAPSTEQPARSRRAA